MRKLLFIFGLVVLVAFVAIQFIPYGHDHSDPAVVSEPSWPSQDVRDLAVRACYDCHSNQTVWPWYSNIAPVSWLIERDVNTGRSRLDFSTWGQPRSAAGGQARAEGRGQAPQGGRQARDGSEQSVIDQMPPWFYLIMHPAAKLTADEKTKLDQTIMAMRRTRNQTTSGS